MKKLLAIILGLTLLLGGCITPAHNSLVETMDIIETYYEFPAVAKVPGYKGYSVYKMASIRYMGYITGQETQWIDSDSQIVIGKDAVLIYAQADMNMNFSAPTTGDWFESNLRVNNWGIFEINIRKQIVRVDNIGGISDQIFTQNLVFPNLNIPLQAGDVLDVVGLVSSNTPTQTNFGVLWYFHWIEKP